MVFWGLVCDVFEGSLGFVCGVFERGLRFVVKYLNGALWVFSSQRATQVLQEIN